jgi:hypothetical protein
MNESTDNALAKVIAKAWSDDDFRARLVADPAASLAAESVDVPEGARVVVLENTDDVVHLVIPAKPRELTDEQLDSVAGGFSGGLQFTGHVYCGD